ncbi:MAG: hypothetical protein A3B11_01560 [Candidatus Taylorbacteria bacterium RIFCSPLOWO2_01_FULL_44_26]|uniref:Uncharacterized protein n=2 Tax=Candidatus Tayloriibacteriota TaxID=1817919 RepID=A0A1G2MLF4_9BACT|nr:MAG: hypothetical protein A3D50_01555 [Candidatus Taylorbacteria bacterium RIFCSPHIGHO2_02_FULL_44_12]OHA31286.1 MAG: hypothetical protein A3B11_01560 [Candidatus Taylorbacteria bacterium RIFCSPLOWO2_01_FULL_44_26]
MKPAALISILILIFFVFAYYVLNMKDDIQTFKYSNEFYSVDYPSDWEQVKVGWEEIDVPPSQRENLALEHQIKNPLDLIILRPKAQDKHNPISIFVVGSPVNTVLDEIKQYEEGKGRHGISPAAVSLPPLPSVAVKNIYTLYFADTASGVATVYYVIAKYDPQNEQMNIATIIQMGDDADSRTREILSSFKFSQYYEKVLFIKGNVARDKIITIQGSPHTFASATGGGVVVLDGQGYFYRLTGTRAEMGEWFEKVSAFEKTARAVPLAKVSGTIIDEEVRTIKITPAPNQATPDSWKNLNTKLYVFAVKEVSLGE